jgi:thiamine-phosphate pyrophosphorylase
VFDLYLITAEQSPAEIAERARAALVDAPAGRVALQLRARHLPERERAQLARTLRAITRERGARLLVSAEIALAVESGADGVQLPERAASVAQARAQLPAGALIGASRHDLAGVQAAGRDGASFVTLSPVFAVQDKGAPLGIGPAGAIARAAGLPVLALGGLDAQRAAAVVAAGAHGVAVIREVFASDDPRRAVARLLAAVDAGRRAGTSR